MTYPDLSINRAGADPQTDVDQVQTFDGSRPLTDEERKAADRDVPAAERVYAPASERVPKDPVAGHREVIQHTDTRTPEREAASHMPQSSSEPTFARVSRPSVTSSFESPTPYDASYPTDAPSPGTARDRKRVMFMGLGFSWFTAMCCGVGTWLFMRWRRERDKPINRIRRQALHAASVIGGRVPPTERAMQPAMGLMAAALSALVVMWRQAQSRSRSASQSNSRRAAKATRQASHAISDVDWQKRLMTLKKRWTPRQLELEKISLSRH